jgi:hypothetical protein
VLIFYVATQCNASECGRGREEGRESGVVATLSDKTFDSWVVRADVADVMEVEHKLPLLLVESADVASSSYVQRYEHKDNILSKSKRRILAFSLGALVLLGLSLSTATFNGLAAGCETRDILCVFGAVGGPMAERVLEYLHVGNSEVGAIQSEDPPKSNGRTDDVQWDSYSLILKGQRIFLQ